MSKLLNDNKKKTSHLTLYFILVISGYALRNILIWFYISSPTRHEHARSHYDDVIMTVMASQITSPTIVYSTVYSGTDQRKHQSSASLAFVRGIHRWPVNSPHKRPVTRKMFPFDDVIMHATQPLLYNWFNTDGDCLRPGLACVFL